ncbi:MAG: diadenylate cyclase CdaA [Anaerolineae bacterium]|nr:diadenylate cyclase CdaA [Anaerolineae bacterium]MDK1081243.1 diadenylate cyclase CdaA [Anaerolineae bacterium]MDK1117550.1 diadenylate cyclase CdaA [Anaerolineae bacterium]
MRRDLIYLLSALITVYLVTDFLNNLVFIFQRVNMLSVVDILLVTLIFFALLQTLRDTRALVLLRGVLFLVVLLALLTSVFDLPAFSWLIQSTLPALLLAIPVIFAPEIRRGLERIGRAGFFLPQGIRTAERETLDTIQAIVSASARLSARQHGAIIVIQRLDALDKYNETGVQMNAKVTPEILLQIFYPNTPLHDGAAILNNSRILAAACILPLSSSGILTSSPERQMGLRHRAALGISEVSDAVAIMISEETGSISIAHSGRMIRGLDSERLENILKAFLRPKEGFEQNIWYQKILQYIFQKKGSEE